MLRINRMLPLLGALFLVFGVLRGQSTNHIVISEIYGGGGNSGALYKNDFIELYNPTGAPVTMSNWSIQYASAASGTYSAKTIFSGTIDSHGYFLIQEAQGSGGSANLPSPDVSGTVNFAASNGKIGLASDTIAISGHGSANVVDFVGYGTANDAEGGTTASGLDNTHSAERKATFVSTPASMAAGGPDEFLGNGFDSDFNGGDFVSRAAPGPQSTASAKEHPPSGNQMPIITSVNRLPFVPSPGAPDTVVATIIDDGIVTAAKVHVRVNGGAYDSTLTMAESVPGSWRAIIPGSKHPSHGTLVEYFVSATDDSSAGTYSAPGGYFAGDVPAATLKAHSLSSIAGYAVQVNGVINVATNTFASGQGFLQDATGGIQLFSSGGLPPLLPGRRARVEGAVVDANGAYEVHPVTFVDTSGSSVLTAAAVSLPLLESASHAFEGRLVTIAGLETDSSGTFIAGRNYLYRNGAGDTITVRVESNGSSNSLAGNPFGAGAVDATGILTFASGFLRLKPRSQIDFGFDPGDGSGTASISPGVRLINMTSIAETLTIVGDGTNTITGASVRIPPSWSWADTSEVVLEGAGFVSATRSVGGDGSAGTPYVITISGASITNAVSGKIVISALGTPSTGGNPAFITSTRSGSGTLTPIAVSPAVNILASGFEAIATGTWSNPAIWAGGVVPGPADDVTMTTTGVVVTIEITGAQCAGLTMTGSGSAANSGPTLQFASGGTPQLTVNGRLRISGGSGAGQGGRAKLSSNGNAGATLVLKGAVTTTTSNATGSGNAGLNMNEGTVRFEGSIPDTLVNSTGLRLANLIVGDGVGTTSLVWAPSRKSTLVIRSLLVRSGSAFYIGAANDSTANDIGNASSSGVPTLSGGIEVEAGGKIAVQECSGGSDAASINIDAGGIANSGLCNLRSASAELSAASGTHYDVSFGDFSAALPHTRQVIGGSSAVTFGNVELGETDTLELLQEMLVGTMYTLSLHGTLVESPGNMVKGRVEATRNVALNAPQDFGGLGVAVTAAGSAPGATLARRVTGEQLGEGINTSILRYFDFIPAVNTGLNASLDFNYDGEELDGQVAGELQLWKSIDGGNHWAIQPSINDAPNHRLHAPGCASLARFSASDPGHPLGGGGTSIPYRSGWNMVSVPNTVPSYNTNILFPSALTHAFFFDGGYAAKETLVNGAGYWLKLGAAETLSLAGEQRLTDTVDIVAGWNMIGSISLPIQTSSLVEIPPGIASSPLFQFDGSYVKANILAPGYGYWIKANAPGKLVLSAAAPPSLFVPHARETELPPSPPGGDNTLKSPPTRTDEPDHYELRSNYPNPFNPVTSFSVDVPNVSEVQLGIYDVLGREIVTLLRGQQSRGRKQMTWDGKDSDGLDVPSGIYFLRMSAEGFNESRKLLLIR